jgi:hypothetical protein
MERLLNCIEHLRFRLGQVAREIAEECLLAEAPFIAVKTMPAVAGGVGNVFAKAV